MQEQSEQDPPQPGAHTEGYPTVPIVRLQDVRLSVGVLRDQDRSSQFQAVLDPLFFQLMEVGGGPLDVRVCGYQHQLMIVVHVSSVTRFTANHQ